MFEIEEVKGQNAKIRVVGIGGAGGNAINNMIASNLHGVEFIAINTDLQVLETSLAAVKIQIGKELTRGLGQVPILRSDRHDIDRDYHGMP
jgi:cell division protein FtsZ